MAERDEWGVDGNQAFDPLLNGGALLGAEGGGGR